MDALPGGLPWVTLAPALSTPVAAGQTAAGGLRARPGSRGASRGLRNQTRARAAPAPAPRQAAFPKAASSPRRDSRALRPSPPLSGKPLSAWGTAGGSPWGRVPGDPPFHKSLRLSGNACQDCAKRKLEENGVEVSKKPRQSGTRQPLPPSRDPPQGRGSLPLLWAEGGRTGRPPPEAPVRKI